MQMHETLGDRMRVSENLHGLAEVLRFQGDLEGAEAGYREVIRANETLGDPGGGAIPRLNLGLCLLKRGDYQQARTVFRHVRTLWERSRKRGYLAVVRACLLPCAAATNNWRAFDDHLTQGRSLIERSQMVDLDIAYPLELGADLADAAGHADRARAAYAMARGQYAQLGQEDRVQAIDDALARLGDP
jgi:tetratricopeptide (TPR) repeat protein